MAVVSCEYVEEEEEELCHHCAGMVVVEIGEEAEREGLEKVIAVGLGNTNWFWPLHGEEYGPTHMELACVWLG